MFLKDGREDLVNRKICKKCNKNKSKKCFSSMLRSRDGLQYYCKQCLKNYLIEVEDKLRGNRPKFAHIKTELGKKIDFIMRKEHQFVGNSCFDQPSEVI